MKTNILKNKCAQYRAPQILKEKGIYPYYKAIESEQSTMVKIHGKDVLMFGSNSYLGLSNDPRLKEAVKAAIGFGLETAHLLVEEGLDYITQAKA